MPVAVPVISTLVVVLVIEVAAGVEVGVDVHVIPLNSTDLEVEVEEEEEEGATGNQKLVANRLVPSLRVVLLLKSSPLAANIL